MAVPVRVEHSEPAARIVPSWSPAAARAANMQLLRGDLSMAGALADAVLADDRLQATLGTRVNGVLGLPLAFEAVDESTRAVTASETLQADWWAFAPEAVLAEWQMYALLAGACAAELVWEQRRGRILPMLKVWHPSHLSRSESGEWRVRLASGQQLTITPGDGKWALLSPHGQRRPGVRALLRSISVPWLLKSFAAADWGQFSEVHGSPTRLGKAPAGSTAEERRKFAEDLGALAADSAIVLPDGWEAELLESSIGADATFERLIDWADGAIAIAVLGQNLTTEVQSGSLAAARVHEVVRQDLIAADSETLVTTLREQVVVWWAEYNLGDRELAPWPKWDTSLPEDAQAVAEAFRSRAEGLKTLADAAVATGMPVDWLRIAADLRIPLVEGVPLTPPRPPTGLGAVRLASGDGLDAARGLVAGQLYTDDLTDRAIVAGGEAAAGLVSGVLDLVQRAGSYEELRRSLLSSYSSLPVDDLVALTESAVTLASLAGRLSVSDDA